MSKVPTRNTYVILFFVISLIVSFFILQAYIISIIIAIIAANLLRPIYDLILKFSYKKSTSLASGLTICFFIVVLVMPITYLIWIATEEAIEVGTNIRSWVQEYIEAPEQSPAIIQKGIEIIESYNIIWKLEESVGKIWTAVIWWIGSLGTMTLNAVLKIFIFLYCIFFFLKDGKSMMKHVISYIPLTEKDTRSIVKKFNRTTLATVKGTLIIGLIQWTLAGIGFLIAGIPGAIFWWAVMIIFSAIPMVGATIIWVPVCIYLAISWDYLTAVVLATYCGVFVGNMDNLLRPRLVWKDVWMHEILVLVSTLWWIAVFWISGFIVWPTIIALCIALWDMYKKTLKNT